MTVLTVLFQEVGADYVEQKMHHYFTFIATIFTALCEEPTKVDNNLVSRITPFLGRALKSPIGPFKCAGLMIVCNLAMHTSLTTEASESFLNLMLLKVTKPWLEVRLKLK
jgi:hypothetical protein